MCLCELDFDSNDLEYEDFGLYQDHLILQTSSDSDMNTTATVLINFTPFLKPKQEFRCRNKSNRKLCLVRNESDASGQCMKSDSKKGVKNLVDSSTEMKRIPPEFIQKLTQNPLSAGNVDVPAIDLRGLDGTPACRASAVDAVGSACSEWGFLRVSNHGVDLRLMKEMLQVTEAFFSLSLEEKMKYATKDVMSPVRYGTSLNTTEKHVLHWRDYLRHYGHPFHNSIHLWPTNPPQYRDVCEKYLKQMWQLAMKIAGAISESLRLDQTYIEHSLGEGSQILAVNYYPPCPEPEKTLGLSGHSDHSGLTVLMDNGVDGLQIKHDGSWIAVPNVPGTLVVNVGDYLEILSNGRYKSVEHRATVNAKKTRISIAAAHGPEFSRLIGPASPLVQESEGLNFQPITFREYLRHQQTIPVRGKSALEVLHYRPEKGNKK